MTITTIQLIDTDLSTVLFDLHSSDGTTNSSWGSVITKFGLGGSFKVSSPLDAERFEHPGHDGGFTTFSRRGLGTAEWRQAIAGTTEANLRLGVGRLTDLLTRGTILRIVTSTTTRYLRLEPSAYPSPFQGKELELHDIFQQFSFRQGLDISTTCQPYWEGAVQTIGPTNIPNDPASTNGRALSVTILGDLPTPVKVAAKIDATAITLQTSAAADDIIDATTHGLVVGDAVVFPTLTGGSGLVAGTIYYVVSTSFATNTFRVAATPGGTALGFSTDITAGTVKLAGTVQSILFAHHTTFGERDATALADYQGSGGTRLMQAEASGGNWTITLGTDTTAQAVTDASPGTGNTVARCTFATTPTVERRIIRGTRSANLDSLRGAWDVWPRLRNTAAAIHTCRLGWGQSTADPAAFRGPEFTHDTSTDGTPPNFGWVEKYAGAVYFSDEVPLSGIALELHARRESGSGNFEVDHFWLVSRDGQGTIVVPGASGQEITGNLLTSPSFKLTSDPAAIEMGAPDDDRHDMLIIDANEAAGWGPNTGTALAAPARYAYTFKLNTGDGTLEDKTVRVRIVNVTDDVEVIGKSLVNPVDGLHLRTIKFDAVVGKLYQPQVFYVSGLGVVRIKKISYELEPVLGLDEQARTDPQRSVIERLDSGGNVTGSLVNQGELSCVMVPGPNILSARADELPLSGYTEAENKRHRILATTLTYFPRYGF